MSSVVTRTLAEIVADMRDMLDSIHGDTPWFSYRYFREMRDEAWQAFERDDAAVWRLHDDGVIPSAEMRRRQAELDALLDAVREMERTAYVMQCDVEEGLA